MQKTSVLNCDQQCRAVCSENANMLVPWYLMASFMYYCNDMPLISDACFDELCAKLAARWLRVKHQHKSIISRDDLAAGTCLLAQESYPAIVRGAAISLWVRLQQAPIMQAEEPTPPRRPRKELSRSGFFV